MKKWISENKIMAAVIVGIIVILGIAFNEFFLTKDEGGITGWQVIQQSGANFWVWLLIAAAVSGVGTYFLVKKLKNSGGVGVSYGLVMAIIIPLMIVFGKACEGKADGGVTTPNGRPEKVLPDSNRIPAEDLLPKK